jgi:hypothetical protein
MWYVKLKAWAALLFGVYVMVQCVALLFTGSFVIFTGDAISKTGQGTIGDSLIGLGVFGLVLGLAITYGGFSLARWGWANI